MGDHDDGVALGVNALELFHDDEGGVGVEVAGGFVSEDDFWVGDDGAGDGGALLLATGELEGEVIFFFFEVEALKDFFGLDEAAGFVVAGVNKGKSDVFDDGEVGDEVEVLEDEADFFGAEAGLFFGGDAGDGLVI